MNNNSMSSEQVDIKVGHTYDSVDNDLYIGRVQGNNTDTPIGMIENIEEFNGVDDILANIEQVEWKPIGERGWLGNPFIMDDDKDEDKERKRVVDAFMRVFLARIHELNDTEFAQAVLNINADMLACWCQHQDETGDAADRCHGEVIVAYIEQINTQR